MAGGYTLPEDDARRLLLTRSVELHDADHQLLTHEDRTQADAHARGEIAGKGKKAQAAFLAERSRFATARLESRHPAIARALKHSRFPRALYWLPGLAFVAGALSNELDGGNRLELLAFPLLGVIAWNVAVYLWLAADTLFGKRRKRGEGPRWWQRLADPMSLVSSGGSGLTANVLGDFTARFTRAAHRLFAVRAGGVLHLSAALFALGLVAGIFLRALTVEYRAGWESTFLGPGRVEALLSTILGPASSLTGIAIPGVEGIAALRWNEDGTGGANAGPWIVLWTATVGAVVVLPRLLLAGWSAARAGVMARRLAVPGREDFTIRRMLRAMGGEAGAGGVRVSPYAYTPGDAAQSALSGLLRDAMGGGTQVTIDTPCPYGAEEDWLARTPPSEEADLHIVLFSLSATPETENHAEFVRLIREFYATADQGVRVAMLVDEQPYRAHFAGQAGLEERIETRLEAWRQVLGPLGLPLLTLPLDGTSSRELAERVESELLGQGAGE